MESEFETSRTKLQEEDVTPQPHRRLIKADLSLRLSSSFEDDDLDDIPATPAELPKPTTIRNGKASIVRSNSHIGASTVESDRRHSISVCESPPKPCNGSVPAPRSSRSLDRAARSDYWKSSQWQSLECLSLTLEEVVHIRNVLTKAELESLIIDPALYEDVLKGKVCFTCKQTRFSFFGAWPTKCKMCERSVCDKCSSKMRIPTEHFARIPVYMLSPTPSPPPEEEESSPTKWKISDVFTFGNPHSTDQQSTPKIHRQHTVVDSNPTKKRNIFRHSESLHTITQEKVKTTNSLTALRRATLQRAKTIQNPNNELATKNSPEKSKGPLMPVCRDCKVMVCNIIKASSEKKLTPKEKKKNSRTWPQKKAQPSPVASCMSPVAETPPSSPDEVFRSIHAENMRQHIPSVV